MSTSLHTTDTTTTSAKDSPMVTMIGWLTMLNTLLLLATTFFSGYTWYVVHHVVQVAHQFIANLNGLY